MAMRFSILTLGDNYAELRSHEQFYHEVIEEAEYAEELGTRASGSANITFKAAIGFSRHRRCFSPQFSSARRRFAGHRRERPANQRSDPIGGGSRRTRSC